jgi:hypothetical protein
MCISTLEFEKETDVGLTDADVFWVCVENKGGWERPPFPLPPPLPPLTFAGKIPGGGETEDGGLGAKDLVPVGVVAVVDATTEAPEAAAAAAAADDVVVVDTDTDAAVETIKFVAGPTLPPIDAETCCCCCCCVCCVCCVCVCCCCCGDTSKDPTFDEAGKELEETPTPTPIPTPAGPSFSPKGPPPPFLTPLFRFRMTSVFIEIGRTTPCNL